MYAARAAKPQLTLSISAAQNSRSLSLKSPSTTTPRTPISPAAASPSGRRSSAFQQPPSYAYTSSCSTKGILKKYPSARASRHADNKRIQFKGTPTVYCVTPIENPEEYYGSHKKLSRDERRWMMRE